MNMCAMTNNRRNPSIELYRAFLVFGIVLLHMAMAIFGPFHWMHLGLMWCVDGFVFITGYFGCNFSFRRLIRLYGTIAACTLIVVSVYWFVVKSGLCDPSFVQNAGWGDIRDGGVREFLFDCFKKMFGFWFVNAYVVMLCLTPMVNSLFESDDKQRWICLLPFFIVVFGWGLVPDLPILHKYKWLINGTGLGSFTALTLLGVYACGRLYRRFENLFQFRTVTLMGVLALLLLIDSFGCGWFGRYASPFAVLTAAVAFALFKRIPLTGDVILLISPSLFSVILLHSFRSRFDLLIWCVDCLLSINKVAACVLVSLGAFVVCVVIDIPRRACAELIRRRLFDDDK